MKTETPEPSSDEALFTGVQEGDPAAWEAFVTRFGPLVATVPTRAGLAADEVDDVVQATWMQLLRHARLIRVPRSLPSWVLTTAARETWRLRSRERSRRHVEREGARDVAQEAADVDLVHLERVQVVHDAVARMGERCRALLQALFLEPLPPPYEELARDLGIAVGSIGPTRQRCLGRLALDLDLGSFESSHDFF